MQTISFTAWKGIKIRQVALTLPYCLAGFFLFVGLAALSEKRDAHQAPKLFAVAAIFAASAIPLYSFARGKYQVGLDKGRNSLFIVKPGADEAVYEKNADKIVDFQTVKFSYAKVNPTFGVNPSMPLYFRKNEYIVQIKRRGSDYYFPMEKVAFATQKDAESFMRCARRLLAGEQ